MDYTKPIKSRRLLVEHLLAVMHTANLADCDSHSLWVTGLDWINKYHRTFDNKNIGLGHTLHNTLYTMVYGLTLLSVFQLSQTSGLVSYN